MTADRFATTIANTLFGPDEQTGRQLMRTAVRLLAQGKPITVTELAAAARVEVSDLSKRARRPSHRIRRPASLHRLGPHPQPHPAHLHRRRPPPLHLVRRGHPAVPGHPRQPRTDRVTLPHNQYRHPPERRPESRNHRPLAGHGRDLDSRPHEMDATHVRATTCNPGRFFATAEAAAGWLTQHPNGTVLPVADAYPQLRPISNQLLDERQTPTR